MARATPAKLVRPKQVGTYRRTRLFAVLDRARPVAWVNGPPGAGKTTLVASFVEARRLRTLWYQLDEGDGDPATLFFYLRQGAVRASPRKRWGLPLLTPEYLAGLGTFTRRWFDELFAGLPKPFVLVFDNHHTVPPESSVHDVLRRALEQLPTGGRAIIVSRADPPPGLARLRAERRMVLIDWEALRLTPAETAGIARTRTLGRVRNEHARALHAATDGWAAGVVLMLERAVANEARPGRDATPPQAVFDYFASEILAGSNDETKQVLLETALLARFTAAQAEALTGSPHAGEILAGLAARRYFTDCHPDPEPTYQYHPLFRDFLLARGRTEIDAARRREVRRTAAALLEQSGAIDDAADVLCEAEDWEGIARHTAAHAPKLLAHGRGATIERWLAALPRAVLEGSPWLLYWLGVCRLPFAPKESIARATQAFDGFTTRGDRAGVVATASLAIDAVLFDWGDFNGLDPWIRALEAILTDPARPVSDGLEDEATASLLGALVWRAPDHPAMAAWADSVERAVHRNSNPAFRVRSAFILGWYYMWLGQLTRAQAMADDLNTTASANPTALLPRLWNLTLEADIAWIRADLPRCLGTVARGLELASSAGVHLIDLLLITARAIGELIANDLTAAHRSLRELRAAIADGQPVRVAQYHYLAGWSALLESDLSAAHAHAEAGERLIAQTGAYFGILVHHHALAQTQFERGAYEVAHRQLADGMRMARAMRSFHVEYMCLLVEADFAYREGRPEAGLDAIQGAFTLGREHGILSGAWWRKDLVARLCARALQAGIETEYARRLVQVHRLVPPPDGTAPEAWPWRVRIRALGPFEVLIEDRPVAFVGRAQRKPLELLKALVAFGGTAVPERQLADALWPDAEGDLAQQSLAVTLHRLRRLLKDDEAIRRHEGRLDLDRKRVWVDAAALEACLANAVHAMGQERARLVDQTLRLYRGPFLAGDDLPWIVAARERLRARFVRELGEVARVCETAGDPDRAIGSYLRALEIDDRAEDLYRRLMAVYGRLGRRAEMLTLYQRCRTTLQTALGVAPSPETDAIARSDAANPRPTS